MPRTPEVCPALFCPLSHFSNIASCLLRILPLALRYLQSAFGNLPPDSCRLPTAFRRPRYTFGLLLLLITCHCSLVAALAQGTTATLSGSVSDQNGAVIPDVSIAVINIAQGFQRSATTNGEGDFVVPLLPPGKYTVKAEHEGFTPTEVRDVVLNVNDQVTIKIHLNIGTISQTVQVVDSARIDDSAAVGTVVDRQLVGNLPLNGRSFQSLLTLSPGVVLTKTTGVSQGQFSVNGQRASANYFTVDGVSANTAAPSASGGSLGQTFSGSLPGLTAFGGTNNLVSVDALQEFKILTSTYAPEFGRTPGAQVTIVTRSGTNDFHGTLFDYFRNDVLDANDWFANAGRLRKPPLRQNDFGGVVGGPLYLPRFGEGGRSLYNGRNRSFFFFSYEGLRLSQPQVVSNVEVPSASLRQGAAAAIQPFLNAFPIPNGATLATELAQFSTSYSNPSTLNATSIRIDHSFNGKLNLFGRYNDAPSNTIQRSVSATSSGNLAELVLAASDIETLTLGTTWAIAARVSNEFRANWSKARSANFFSLDSFGGAVPPQESLLFPPFTTREKGRLAFSLSFGGAPRFDVGKNAESFNRQLNLVDSTIILVGPHTVKVGIDYRRLSGTFGPQEYALTAQFTNASAVRLARPNSTYSVTATQGSEPIFNNLSAFGQDMWRVLPRLNITYGLRWEVNPPPSEANGNDLLAVIGINNLATASLGARGTPIYKTTYNNFAPRFGAAYQILQRQGGELVLRGGFGVFYDLGNGQAATAFSLFPYSSTKTLPANTAFPLDSSLAAPAPLNTNLTPPFGNLVAFGQGFKLPRTYQWNFSLEQSLGSQQTISASYVGAAGRRLVRNNLVNVLPLNANFRFINIITNGASSDYHALQLQFQRRLSQGLQALANYSWSHSIDDASDENSSGLLGSRGASDFDVRHAFSAAISYKVPILACGSLGKTILRDWSVDTVITARSATPVNLVARTIFLSADGVSTNVRPDLILGVPLYRNEPLAPGGRRFNPAAFVAPPANPFRQGTLGRNVLRGFSIYQIDFSTRRQFNLTERWNLQFRADLFNIFNHPNFGDPIGSLTSGSFGRSTNMFGRSLGGGGVNGGFNPLYQVGGPRSIQFSLKLQF
jgi:hypothetical protein